MDLKVIENVDHEIAGAITMEIDRQKNTLELIASENIASPGGHGRSGKCSDQ